MGMRAATIRLLACTTAMACVADDHRVPQSSAVTESFLVRDSAGQRIVENFADTAELPLWRPQLEHAIRLGVQDGNPSQEFGEIIAGFRLGDGSLVVVDAGAQGIRYFAGTGEHKRTVGRRGRGPGEFQRIGSAVRLAGDSISVWDNVQRRATLLTPDGRVARTAQIEQPLRQLRPGVTITGNSLSAVTAAEGGRWISVSEGIAVPPVDGPLPALVTVPIAILSHGERGEFISTLADAPGKAALMVPPPIGDTRDGPFRPAEAYYPAMTLKTYVSHGPVFTYMAASQAFDVVAFDRGGTQQWRSRYPRQDREFTRADVEARRAISLASAITPDRRRALEHMTDPRWAPALWPSLGALLADHAGNVWVRSWQRDGDDDRWIVIDDAGRAVAVAETPRGLQISSIDSDHLVGVERDSLGVHYLVVAPLKRTPR